MSRRGAAGAGASARLALNPRACDRCGRCLKACERGAIKVGRTYLAVDWTRCDGCGACARACGTKAIALRAGASPAAERPPKPRPRPRTGEPAGGGRPKAGRDIAGESRARFTVGQRAKAGAGSRVGLVGRLRAGAAAPKTGSRGGFQWTLLEAAAMLSVTFSAFMVKEVLAASGSMRALPSGLAIPVRVGVLAVYYAIQVVLLVWLVRRRGGEPAAALGLRVRGTTARHALTSAGLVIVGLVITRLVASVYAFVTREIGIMPSSGVDLPTLFGSDATGLALAVLMVGLVGPVVEEAVFRAALLEGLAARFGAWPAIILQATLFAAFHRSFWLLFPMFTLGVALGWLAHERQSLWPPIALHALYNAITVAAAFLVAASG